MDVRHRYCEANSVAERSHPEPESSVDLDNDDEDKLVIVEDPGIELPAGDSSNSANVSTAPEVSRTFRGPKKKFLEAFVRSKSISSEGDNTTGVTLCASVGLSSEKGGASIDVTCSSLSKDSSKSIPTPDSNGSNEKVCDSSTKLDDDGDDAKKKDMPMFNLRSCIDLIIDSRLIRDRLNTSTDILNEEYNIKVSLSRVNEAKAAHGVMRSSAECNTLRNVLSVSEGVKEWDGGRTVSAQVDAGCPVGLNSPSVGITTIAHGDRIRRYQYEGNDPIPARPTITSSTAKYSDLAIGSQADTHSHLHQMAALASLLPKQPIAMATEADKIVTGRTLPHHPSALTPKVGYSKTDHVPHRSLSKKSMLPLIDTKASSTPIIDVDAYSGGQCYDSRSWTVDATPLTKLDKRPDDIVEKQRHEAQICETYRQRSNSSGRTNMAGPLSWMVEMTNPNEHLAWGGGGYTYSSSGGQLVAPPFNRPSTSQLSPGMPSASGPILDTPQPPVRSHYQQRQVALPAEHHPRHTSQYSPQYVSAAASGKSPIGGNHSPSPRIQPRKSPSPHLPSDTYVHPSRGHYGDAMRSEYAPAKIPVPSPTVTLLSSDSRRDSPQQSDYGHEGHAQLRCSPAQYGSQCTAPPLLYLPTSAARSPSKVPSMSSEPPHSSRTHATSFTSHPPASSPTHWGWSHTQPKSVVKRSPCSAPSRMAAPPAARDAPLDLTTRWASDPPAVPAPIARKNEYRYAKTQREETPLDLTVQKSTEPLAQSYSTVQDYGLMRDRSSMPDHPVKVPRITVGIIPCTVQPRVFAPVTFNCQRLTESPQSQPPLHTEGFRHSRDGRPPSVEHSWENYGPASGLSLPPVALMAERPFAPSISKGVIDPDVEKQQQTQTIRTEQKKLLPQQLQQQLQQQQQQQLQQQQQQQQCGGARGQVKMSTTAQLLGNHPPHDILYLKCNVCTSTYGSLHSFRKHFWKVHGCGPTNEHVTVRSISATRGSAANTEKAMDEIEKPVSAELALTTSPQTQSPSDAESAPPSRASPVDYNDQPYDVVHMQVQRPCTLGEMQHKMAPLSDANHTNSLGTTSKSASSSSPKLDVNQSTMRCLQCGQDFPTRDWGVFRRHVRAHDQPTLRCTLCRQTFVSPRDLQEHNHTYHQDQMWLCRVCGVGFVHPGDLGKHMKLVHPSDSTSGEDYKCQLCPMVFDDVQKLLVHLNEHNDQPDLASRYAELLVPGSFSVRRASPDSTNDMVEQKPDLAALVKQEAGSPGIPYKNTSGDGSPLLSTAETTSGKSPVVSLPKKALYEFIKEKVEHEARKQLTPVTAVPSPPPSVCPASCLSIFRPPCQNPEVTNQNVVEAQSSSSKALVSQATSSSGVSEQESGVRPFKTMRDALHLLVEHAITHDYEKSGSRAMRGECQESVASHPVSKDGDGAVRSSAGNVKVEEQKQQEGTSSLREEHTKHSDAHSTVQTNLCSDAQPEANSAESDAGADRQHITSAPKVVTGSMEFSAAENSSSGETKTSGENSTMIPEVSEESGTALSVLSPTSEHTQVAPDSEVVLTVEKADFKYGESKGNSAMLGECDSDWVASHAKRPHNPEQTVSKTDTDGGGGDGDEVSPEKKPKLDIVDGDGKLTE